MEIDVECKYIAQGLSARGKDYVIKKVPIFKCQKMALRAPKSKNRLQKPFWDTLKTMSTSVGKTDCGKEMSKKVNQHVKTPKEGG